MHISSIDTDLHPKIKRLSKKLREIDYLSSILTELKTVYPGLVTFGLEVEFYLVGESNILSIKELEAKLPHYKFIKERGKSQFEYHIGPSSDPRALIKELHDSIDEVKDAARQILCEARFDPKPYEGDYGNALQVQFTSPSPSFQNNIDRICACFCLDARRTFLAYAPSEIDYERFDHNFMTPTHIAYGPNNRSCLIRICGDEHKRVEVRAPSILCDLYLVFCTIIRQIILASKSDYTAPRIYGLAHDPQYNLKKIPSSQGDAARMFDEGFYDIAEE